MKNGLIKRLVCPDCRRPIELTNVKEQEGEEIMEGDLTCSSCKRVFPILRGVPRFANLHDIEEDKAATAFSFGWQWTHFTHQDERYAHQFLGWITPVKPEFFKDKLVLDAGCGKGRHTLLAEKWGAREIISVDLSDAVDTAFAATRDFDNVHVVQADVCRLPFGRIFDYAYCVGVLIILKRPTDGFNSLASVVKPGGHLSVWGYGAEKNGWITSVIDPIRIHITSQMHPYLLMQASKVPTAVLFALTKFVYGPLKKVGAEKLAHKLFYGPYMTFISDFGWREHHTIVFDHLVAPTVHYVAREEFEEWWSGVRANDVEITWHNKNSWCGFGEIPEEVAAPARLHGHS